MTIDLNFSSDQNQIVASLGKALSEQFPVSRLRGRHAASPDRAHLPALAELGVFGLGTSDEAGGAGFDITEEMLLFTELGRYLVTPNALAATLAARLAIALGMAELARAFVSGHTTVCIANALSPFGFDDVAGVQLHLMDAQGASFALLWSDTGIVLLRLEGLAATPVASTDRSVSIHRCTLSESAVLGRLAAGQTSLVREAHLLVCAMLLGMAEATRDMAVDYAKVRMQFGRPIGAFQAVKHRCANMAISAETLKAQLVFAALAERDAWPDATFQNDACRLLAARCALSNAAANIQVHGGMGFTAECDAHLYLLRAHLYEHIGGSKTAARQRLTKPPSSKAGRETAVPTSRTL